jgi:hypothetical protein
LKFPLQSCQKTYQKQTPTSIAAAESTDLPVQKRTGNFLVNSQKKANKQQNLDFRYVACIMHVFTIVLNGTTYIYNMEYKVQIIFIDGEKVE